jgi:hypothetical protein
MTERKAGTVRSEGDDLTVKSSRSNRTAAVLGSEGEFYER